MSRILVDQVRSNSASSDAITLDGSGNVTVPGNITLSGNATLSGTATGFPDTRKPHNLVINGAMQVSQRGSSFTGVDQQEYTIDRFITLHSYGSSTINVINSSQSPDGFAKSYKVDVTAADTSIGSGQYMFIRHKIEAQNLQSLAYGTTGAKSITLSFYVRSTVTGTYAICLQQKDNSSKQVNGTYTINSADTWEKKTFTFAGDQGGVINNDNGHGLDILWTLVAGSDRTSGSARPTWTAHANADESYGHTANVLSSTSNNWHLTGVQLEVGTVATDFEHLSYGDELLKCQRYYFKESATYYAGMGYGTNSSSNCLGVLQQPCVMRATPTATLGTASYWSGSVHGGGQSASYSFVYGQPDQAAGPRLAGYELSAEL